MWRLPVFGLVWGVTGTGTLIAQTVPGSGTTVDVIGLIAQLGLSGVFFWLYRDERNQRMKRDDQIIDLTTMQTPILASVTAALTRFEQSVSSTVNRATQLPDREDLQGWQRAMETAVVKLSNQVTEGKSSS